MHSDEKVVSSPDRIIRDPPWYMHWTLVKYFFLLKNNAKFRYLWLGYLVSIIGDLFSFIANIQVINRFIPDKASIGVALYLVVAGVPSAVISPVAGILADRLDRRKLMLFSDGVRVICALCFIFVRSADLIWLLFVIEIVSNVCSGIFDPARAALIPNLFDDPDELIVANSLDGSTWSIGAAMGSGIGGLIVALLGTDANFVIDSGTYIVSSTCIIILYVLMEKEKRERATDELNVKDLPENNDVAEFKSEDSKQNDQQLEMETVDKIEMVSIQESEIPKIEDVLEGSNTSELTHVNVEDVETAIQDERETEIKIEDYQHESKSTDRPKTSGLCSMPVELIIFFWRNPDIFLLCFVRGCLSGVWGGAAVGHIKYTEEEGMILNNGPLTLGVYYSVIGVAAFTGPLIVQRFCDKSPLDLRKWFVIGFFVQFIGTLMSAISFHITWMLFWGSWVRPIGESMTFMIGITLLQRLVPDYIRGRVFAFAGAFLTCAQALSGLVAGLLSDIFLVDLHSILLIVSGFSLLFSLMWLTYFVIWWRLSKKGYVQTEWPKFQEDLQT